MKPLTAVIQAVFIALTIAVCGLSAIAQPKGPPAPRMHEEEDSLGVPDIVNDGESDSEGGQRRFGKGKFAEKLGLSPEQREKLKAVRGDRTDQEKRYLQLKLQRLELRDMIEKGEASDEAILKQAEELSKSMVDQSLQRIKKMLAMRKILTPEQRVKFKELIAERRDAWKDQNQENGPDRGGPGGGFGRGDGSFRKRFGFGH